MALAAWSFGVADVFVDGLSFSVVETGVNVFEPVLELWEGALLPEDAELAVVEAVGALEVMAAEVALFVFPSLLVDGVPVADAALEVTEAVAVV